MLKLQAGDIFCSRNPIALINTVQKFWASDNDSKYTHAGIIIDPEGNTLESLWKVSNQNIYKAYKGKRIIIGRHVAMTHRNAEIGLLAVDQHYKQFYPFLRLLLFGFPIFAKYAYFKKVIGSELTAKFLMGAGFTSFWKGVNPDMIYDMILKWRGFTVIFEGILNDQSNI